MDTKPNYFLTQFLKPIKKTSDNISIRLSILFLLKHIAPQKFKELNLDQYLESVISAIKPSVEKQASLLKSAISKIKGIVQKQSAFYDLQTKLDYWYYTKLLGYGNKYKVSDESIKAFITDEKIKTVTDPKDAVLLYIYVRILSSCDSEKYGQFKKYVPLLRNIANKDNRLYAYFLTHVILYDTDFGQKNAPQSSFEALKELQAFCENNFNFERNNVDLMAEIIICCKLCKAYDFPFYAKIVRNIIPTEKFMHYHENAVLAAATFDLEQS